MARSRVLREHGRMVVAIVAVLALVLASDVLELALARKQARKRTFRLLQG